jgi:hypothetical protein
MRITSWIPQATHTHTHTHRICNTYCLYPANNGCTNAPQCYIIRTLPVLLVDGCYVICNLSDNYDAQFEVLQWSFLELLDPKEQGTTNFRNVGNYLHGAIFRTIWIFYLKYNLLCSF